MRPMRTCVTPEGRFRYGIHKPAYTVVNLRRDSRNERLGSDESGHPVASDANFPLGDVEVTAADWIFEIPNPLPFRGTTFIDKEWADNSARNPERIRIAAPPPVSLCATLRAGGVGPELIDRLPPPLQLALATTSTDPEDLMRLARCSCDFDCADNGTPVGLHYTRRADGSLRPAIRDHLLFEAVANNPLLPDSYKIVMVIRPGAQGNSEIVGEWPADGTTHVFEYLRRNSYIAGGHYAANMADDAIRYAIGDLGAGDMRALRHLYYQRSYVRLAAELGLPSPAGRREMTAAELETLRQAIAARLQHGARPTSSATLWGWNFGFDYAPTGYRLHASHQQVHQQYAMLPEDVACFHEGCDTATGCLPAFGCGDMIAEVIEQYRQHHGSDFFADYQRAIAGNRRMDGRNDLESGLVVWGDEHVLLFVPKAQTSQWELQLMTRCPDGRSVGNIVEADRHVRQSLDTGILMAQKALAGLGARMVTSIEYPKRLGSDLNQPLLYAFLPRLPESPGAFSEAQLRFINGHYPEDFAAACRRQLG
ncbi:MAG: hypothetical protein F9K32_16015 [Desulfobulbaceae bacterium]|nr:MAG: hypothetical protein F9K32_16015 [Desulfobulbaceae bacterium]